MQKKDNLTPNEIEERVAVLKQFKALLHQQREKFKQYLDVLEAQEKSIADENVDAIMAHTELEQSIISEIYTIQKVIDPMEQMYKYIQADNSSQTVALKTDLDKLQKMVLQKNKENREKIKTHMAGLRRQISSLKPTYNTKNVFAETNQHASMIDLQA